MVMRMTDRTESLMSETLDEIKKEMFMEEKTYPLSEWDGSRKKVKG